MSSSNKGGKNQDDSNTDDIQTEMWYKNNKMHE